MCTASRPQEGIRLGIRLNVTTTLKACQSRCSAHAPPPLLARTTWFLALAVAPTRGRYQLWFAGAFLASRLSLTAGDLAMYLSFLANVPPDLDPPVGAKMCPPRGPRGCDCVRRCCVLLAVCMGCVCYAPCVGWHV